MNARAQRSEHKDSDAPYPAEPETVGVRGKGMAGQELDALVSVYKYVLNCSAEGGAVKRSGASPQ